MDQPRPDLPPQSREARLDRVGLILAAVLALAFGLVLWSQAGRDVFSAMMAGLWALCF